MIDYILQFTSESAAQTNQVVGHYYQSPTAVGKSQWNTSVCIPNIQAWNPANDTTIASSSGGTIITHTYLSGWWIAIGLPNGSSALDALAANVTGPLQLILNRDLATSTMASSIYTIFSKLGTNWASQIWAPRYLGSSYQVP